MQIILAVVIVRLSDGRLEAKVVRAPSLAVCESAIPSVVDGYRKTAGVRDAEMSCVALNLKDTA